MHETFEQRADRDTWSCDSQPDQWRAGWSGGRLVGVRLLIVVKDQHATRRLLPSVLRHHSSKQGEIETVPTRMNAHFRRLPNGGPLSGCQPQPSSPRASSLIRSRLSRRCEPCPQESRHTLPGRRVGVRRRPTLPMCPIERRKLHLKRRECAAEPDHLDRGPIASVSIRSRSRLGEYKSRRTFKRLSIVRCVLVEETSTYLDVADV
jgi:hypothetical protein